MKKPRHTAEQVAFALRQTESGTQVSEVCRRMGMQTHNVRELFMLDVVTFMRCLSQR